jgi:hypothetical protein
MPAIEVLDIVLPEAAHEEAWPCRVSRRQQEMYMIGHQDIGMHLACGLDGILAGEREIDHVVGIACEAGASIVTALDDV